MARRNRGKVSWKSSSAHFASLIGSGIRSGGQVGSQGRMARAIELSELLASVSQAQRLAYARFARAAFWQAVWSYDGGVVQGPVHLTCRSRRFLVSSRFGAG